MMRKFKKDAVSPVIAVILMVAITVVLAGVLYVWVTSLGNTSEDKVIAYRLSVKDASYNKDNKGDTFAVGESLVRLEQNGGDPIDWNGHDIYLEKQNSSERIRIEVASIANVPFDSGNNSQSEVGQFVELKAVSEDFHSGDWVKLVIVYGSQLRFKSPGYMVIY